MAADVTVDGKSLDETSQRLLLELADGDEETLPMKTGTLADAAGTTNQKVLYRMDAHLLGAGVVAERHEDREARCFELTEEGAAFVDDHRGDLERPGTVEEACQVAADARDAVADLRERVESVESVLEDGAGPSEEELDDLRATVEDLEETLAAEDSGEAAGAPEVEDRLAALRADHEEVKSVAEDLYHEAKATRALRDAGLVGRLRWLLTGTLPEA